LALSTDLTAEQREFLTLAKSSTDSLLIVINDILDYSKIEAGKVMLDPVHFNLAEMVGDTTKSMALSAHKKGLELAFSIDPQLPRNLLGDALRLRQVIVNLIGNAIKFTEQGGVVLSVSLHSWHEEELVLHFSVQDTGIGIHPDKQETIFRVFEQADSSTTRLYGGTGLGLAISAQIVQLMDGRLWVESLPGTGSTFHFTAQLRKGNPGELNSSAAPAEALCGLPVFIVDDKPIKEMELEMAVRKALGNSQASVSMASSPAEPLRQRHLRILVTEDNPVNQKLAVRMLEKIGHSVVVAANGKLALETWQQEHFDLIFMDVQMPEMDGFEATSEIRKREMADGQHIPIIAMTAHAMLGDRERCLAAGMDYYISKPVNRDVLMKTIESAMQGQSQAAVMTSS
jgi:CheY-like chemotaxis protein